MHVDDMDDGSAFLLIMRCCSREECWDLLTVTFAPLNRSSHRAAQERYFPMEYSFLTSLNAFFHSDPVLGLFPSFLLFVDVVIGVILALRLVEKILSKSILDCGRTIISGPVAILSFLVKMRRYLSHVASWLAVLSNVGVAAHRGSERSAGGFS